MMRSFTLTEIAEAVDGSLIGDDLIVNSVSTDSRSVEPGSLFVALSGANFDGNSFATQAVASGALACLVTREISEAPCIVVDDAARAYGALAKLNRSEFKGHLIALTGSAGKTTTKEMLAQVLSTQGNTLKTSANLNNTIGVPKTLLSLDSDHRYAVVEMGANAPGEIAFSVEKALPNISIILNASEAHTQGFGDLSGVIKAKGEILNTILPNGFAILNADDSGFGIWSEQVSRQGGQLFTFGLTNSVANLKAKNININSLGCAEFDVVLNDRVVGHCQLSVPGKHQVSNALAVISCCIILDVPVKEILASLKVFTGVEGRISLLEGLNGSSIYDDTYNASPASMIAAIDMLASLPGKHIVVLADMGELGEQSEFHHQQVASYAVKNLKDVRLLGPTFSRIAPEHSFENKQKLINSLKADVEPKMNILIKGSNAMKMNEVVSALVEKELS